MLPLKGHEANPHSCFKLLCNIKCETKWQAPGRRAKKYSPTTIRKAQQCLKFLAYYALTQQHFEAGTKHEQQAAIFKTEDRSSGKKSFKTTIYSEESAIFHWSNKL